MKIKWHQLIVYFSVAFLLVYLIKQGKLIVPPLYSPLLLSLSVICLILGFLVEPWLWRSMLRQAGFQVSVREAFAAVGTTVFGKYIPGKVVGMVGRAAYVKEKQGHSLLHVFSLTFAMQILSLWVAFSLGALCFIKVTGEKGWGITYGFLWLMLTLILFTPHLNRLFIGFAKNVLNKDLSFFANARKLAKRYVPGFFVIWILWSLGFYLMTSAFLPEIADVWVLFAWALSAAAGIVTLISPGGIGVREGVLAFALIGAGITSDTATSLAVISRMWFLVGEAAIFAIGLIALYGKKKSITPQPAEQATSPE